VLTGAAAAVLAEAALRRIAVAAAVDRAHRQEVRKRTISSPPNPLVY
jgi:hypothetical protein